MSEDLVFLCGVPSEPPLRMVASALDDLGAPYVLFTQRHFEATHISFELTDGIVTGFLEVEGTAFPLEAFGAAYMRLMDHQFLPELRDVSPDASRFLHATRLHEVLWRWCEIMPGRVVNRARPNGSNASKPYQAQLIERYFRIPSTLVSNDPEEARAFWAEHGRVVYKSTSGCRSIVQELTDRDLSGLPRLEWCPAIFQELIVGTDVRVHVIASGEVFATAVTSGAIDYRYAHRLEGKAAELVPYDLPDEAALPCLQLASALGLEFAGLDLKVTPAGDVYCFEVNPSPAFSYYEEATGQPIASALARYLSGVEERPG